MSSKLLNWSIFVLLCFIWGSSFIMMKESKQALNPFQIGGLRIFSAGLVFLPFGIYHLRHLPRKKIGLLVLTGLFGNLLPAFLFPAAMLKLDSSLSGILNSLTPICVVIIGVCFFREKIELRRILGVALGFAGLCLLTLTRTDIHLNNIGYAFLVLLATISYGINVNLVSHFLKEVKPIPAATISLSFMILPCALVLWQQDFLSLDFTNNAVQWSVLNVVMLGVVSSAIATVLFYVLVKKAGGLFASLVTYGIPFVAIFWGLLDGEETSLLTIACLLLILLGVFLANRKSKTDL